MSYQKLIEAAVHSMQYSYSPYSKFSVGAALLCEDGKIYNGCNIENSSFSATACAERTAIFKAVSDGVKSFEAIAIVGGKNGDITDYCPPCGVCRQVLSEFCDNNFKIILFNGNQTKIYTLGDLLPLGFTGDNL